MMLPYAPLAGSYSLRLVGLSIVIAVLAAGAALDLAGRVTATQGRARLLWLAGGGAVMGFGIWSMHYTGMLAFLLPVPVVYHVPTVALSLVTAILASVVALYAASRERLNAARTAWGSLIMGGGIATMHYTGMAAMRLPATMHWNLWLVVASLVIAFAVSAVALQLAFRLSHTESNDWSWRKAGSALVMGAAIPGMHYAGMAAARFVTAEGPVDLNQTVTSTALGADAIGAVTLLVLIIAIGTSILDRRTTAQARRLQAALTEVKTLRGLLPICAECKRVRTDGGAWQQIEAYVQQRTEAAFSHGICPDCERRWLDKLV